jgi:hypothetical protein
LVSVQNENILFTNMKFKCFKIYFKTSNYGFQNSITHSNIIWLKSYYIEIEDYAYDSKYVSEFGYHLLSQSNRRLNILYTKCIYKFINLNLNSMLLKKLNIYQNSEKEFWRYIIREHNCANAIV